jgi:TatD DNase family protein
MKFIDTHAHLYLNHFDNDRNAVIERAADAGIHKIILPNIDSGSIVPLNKLCEDFPEVCYPLIGLHPTSVKENYKEELQVISHEVTGKYKGIGEIGIDLYWDKTFLKEQAESFYFQLDLAVENNLPVVIHARESFNEIFDVLENFKTKNIRGIFHAFTGSADQAVYILENYNFYFGIGGIVTYKNSGLDEVIKIAGLDRIVLETDSPYLPPVPHRGKRNESGFLVHTAEKIAEICNTTTEKVASITTENAMRIFSDLT